MNFGSLNIASRQSDRAGIRILVLICLLLACFKIPAAHAASGDHLSALTFRLIGDENRTRIVAVFDKEPEIHSFLLAYPYRLIFDLPETRFGFDAQSIDVRGMVSAVRLGLAAPGRSRIILSVDKPFKVENIQVQKGEADEGYRFSLDVVSVPAEEFTTANVGSINVVTAAASEAVSDAAMAAMQSLTETTVPGQKFRVMIDAGHGGIDSGAESTGGLKEKDITLAFAQELRQQIAQSDDVEVLMTRDDDTFLRLSERVSLARQAKADLFISIHADTITQSDIRGATVYTISDRASDAVAKAMADRENRSDAIGGAVAVDMPEVADILMDLTRRETHSFSLNFADNVVNNLRGNVNLITNPHRFAGFQVLTAPDVPSVLIEIGYLSNSDDEKLINSPEWRRKMAERIAISIREFKQLKRPSGLSQKG